MDENSVTRSELSVLFRLLLCTLQFFLGAAVGYLCADALIATDVTILERGGRVTQVHVVVRVLGIPIQEESGFVATEDGVWELRESRRVAVSSEQLTLIGGLVALASLVGGGMSLGLGILLSRSRLKFFRFLAR